MAERRGHEAGSRAAANQAEARSKQLEREGKFLVDQVEDGVVAPGRTKRNAPNLKGGDGRTADGDSLSAHQTFKKCS